MIPFIRSLSELMAITESRETQNDLPPNNESYNSIMDSGQRKRYTRSLDKKDVGLPSLPKQVRRNWITRKEKLSRFVDELPYFEAHGSIRGWVNKTLNSSPNLIEGLTINEIKIGIKIKIVLANNLI